jgi:hypothetical protein
MAPSPRTAALLSVLLISAAAWSSGQDMSVDPSQAEALIQAGKKKAQDAARAEKERRKLVPKVGHGSQGAYDYDIWQHNCHTAANAFLCFAPDRSKAGIVACGGDPRVDPAHHTFNWIVLPTQTCLYNWGSECCWPETSVPPNIASGPGKACAVKGCGEQYCKGTHCLPPGKNVERPSVAVCAIIEMGGRSDGVLPVHPDMSPERKPACNVCCDSRSNMWNWDKSLGDKVKFEKEREKFRAGCKNYCDAIFD